MTTVIETGLIRRIRQRQEAEADAQDLALLAGLVNDLLLEALKNPEIQSAVCDIVAADALLQAKLHHPSMRGARRGG